MNATTEAAPVPAVFSAGQQMTAGELMMNPAIMEALYKFATVMADSKFTVPKHLQGNVGDCLAVAMQATLWGMHPFTVAQKTHQVGGTLGYEAQLVNAVVELSGAIVGGFEYEFKGSGANIECRVGAIRRGRSEITWGEWLSAATVTTKNSPLWKTNPKQQMGYLQVKNWARLYAPGAILGVYTPDELEAIPARERDITPGVPAIANQGEPDQELLIHVTTEAGKGVEAYRAAWAGLTKDQRHSLRGYHEQNKQIAEDTDRERTLPAAGADSDGVIDDEFVRSMQAAEEVQS